MKKILLVDDDPDISAVVKLILKAHNYNVQTHSDGYNVPDIVDDFTPDLILLDVSLPGKYGTEICKELKEVNTTPIILFSAHASYSSASKPSCADAFIAKPFEITHLINTVNSLVS